jgi:cellulose synthase/poly-beta-1,6-N-acetylglucosamine synthase-like glycosyltransferase
MNTIRILIWLILAYYLLLHLIYLVLMALGSLQARRYRKGISFTEFRRIGESSLTMPISLIVPCFNEAPIIGTTIRNLLQLHYPQFEIIVVSDGSTDGTIDVLGESFGLRKIDRSGRRLIPSAEILAVHESEKFPNLVVVEKTNGRRADAINAGVALARYPLLCVIDADCLLEPDTLIRLARPFLRDSRTAAVAGVVRPSNGLVLENGEITERRLPRTILGINQEIEYARSFQWARIGLSRLRSMLCISGAMILIRKSLFVELGGPWPRAVTDDIEFTMRLNRKIHDRRNRRNERLVFAPDAVCYTEVPETPRQYASQRNRWQRGTLQALWRNRGMMLNPRYGLTGLFGMPFFLVFEGLAAVVELTAWILMVVALVLGIASGAEILWMLFLAYILGVFLSLCAVLLTETSLLRSASWSDFWRVIAALLMDNLGVHQFHLLCRVVGTIQYLCGRRDLGLAMTRRDYTPLPA